MAFWGITSDASGGGADFIANFGSFNMVTASENGSITHIHAWVRVTGGSGTFRFALYKGSSTQGTSLVYYSPSDITITADGLYEVELPAPYAATTGDIYWVGIRCISNTACPYITAAGNFVMDYFSFGSSAPTILDGSVFGDNRYAAFVEYTAGGSTPTISSLTTTLRSGSSGNTYATTGMASVTSVSIGTLAATSVSDTAGSGTFAIPALVDETVHELYGTRTVTVSNGTNSPTVTRTFLPAVGWDFVTLGSSINSTVTGIVYGFSPAAVQNDLLVYDPTKIIPDTSANAEISHTGSQILWHIQASTKIARSYTVITGVDAGLSAQLTSSSTTTAPLTTALRFTASLTSVAAVVAPLTTAIRFSAAAVGQSTIVAPLTTQRRFTAALTTSATLTADLSTNKVFTASLTSLSAIVAPLTAQTRFAASLGSVSSVSAQFAGSQSLQAVVSSLSAVTASLTTQTRFTAVLAAQSSVVPILQTQKQFQAALIAVSSLTAPLTHQTRFGTNLSAMSVIGASLTGGTAVALDPIVTTLRSVAFATSGRALTTSSTYKPVTFMRGRKL